MEQEQGRIRFPARSEWPAWLIIAGMFALAFFFWDRVPERMPVHFDLTGEPDRYGSRFAGLFVAPLAGLGVYLLMILLPKIDPGRANYATFKGVYNVIRYGFLGLFLGLQVTVIAYALAPGAVDVNLIIPPLVGLLFIVLGNLLGKVRPNWFVGLKTPWTISSKRSWVRTHRLGGRLMVLLGLMIAPLGLLRHEAAIWLLIGFTLAYVAFMFWYSWRVWRDDPDRTPPAGTLPDGDEGGSRGDA